MSFESCNLNYSSFYGVKLKGTKFINCVIHETDFTTADLSAVSFTNCDLLRCIFVESILEKCDFSTAFNFSIDPELNRMKKAIFSTDGLIGLLHKYQIEVV